jgi:hypothetical protein
MRKRRKTKGPGRLSRSPLFYPAGERMRAGPFKIQFRAGLPKSMKNGLDNLPQFSGMGRALEVL